MRGVCVWMDAYVDGWTMDGAMWRARVEQKSERDIASLFFFFFSGFLCTTNILACWATKLLNKKGERIKYVSYVF